ncbi:MAG TPA: redoxin domain-containing protein [Beijerinckiaceae bacterium]|nr:redoxin domain-containing protein [Beijerinckiaceae bacterium]
MFDLVPLMPRLPVPKLRVDLAGGGIYDLGDEKPKLFSMIVFYRGLHCGQCHDYLVELEQFVDEFGKRGIESVAISCDAIERGERTKRDWGLDKTRIGHGLSLAAARDWGLFLTQGRLRAQGLSEPAYFCEPALFLVTPDKTLWFSSVQTMAFARPRFPDIIDGFEFLFARGYFTDKECPARGEILILPE